MNLNCIQDYSQKVPVQIDRLGICMPLSGFIYNLYTHYNITAAIYVEQNYQLGAIYDIY